MLCSSSALEIRGQLPKSVIAKKLMSTSSGRLNRKKKEVQDGTAGTSCQATVRH